MKYVKHYLIVFLLSLFVSSYTNLTCCRHSKKSSILQQIIEVWHSNYCYLSVQVKVLAVFFYWNVPMSCTFFIQLQVWFNSHKTFNWPKRVEQKTNFKIRQKQTQILVFPKTALKLRECDFQKKNKFSVVFCFDVLASQWGKINGTDVRDLGIR